MDRLLVLGLPFFVFHPLDRISSYSTPVLAVVALFYFLPSIVAAYLGSTRCLAILIVNALLGWSLLGWLGTLLWALYGQDVRTMWLEQARLEPPPRLGQLSSAPRRRRPAEEPAEPTFLIPLLATSLIALFTTGVLYNDVKARDAAQLEIRNANAVAAGASLLDDLDVRATFAEIVAACGQPEQHWTTTIGQGIHEQDVEHLWYSRIPAEIRLSDRPNETNDQYRHWVFAGAATGQTSESTYSGETLKEEMPCMAKWADAYTVATKDRQGTVN